MSETEAKKHAPSARKLRKQREEGSVASSRDLAGLIAAAAGIATLAGTAGTVWETITATVVTAPDLLAMPFDEAVDVAASSLTRLLLMAVLPVVLATIAAGVVAGLLFNKGVVFAMKPVTPQMNRLSPTEGLKRVFGKRGWVEVAAAFLRIAVWLVFAGLCAALVLPGLVRSPDCVGLCQVRILGPLAWVLVIGAVVLMLIYAGLDMLVQTRLFLGEQKMTDTEKKRELQEQFGSRELRKERSRLRNEARRASPMPLGPADANMLFFTADAAIAVVFKPPETQVPYVVAKAHGAAEVAALRKLMLARGVFEAASDRVVKAGIGKDLGGMLDPSAFDEFARICREGR